MNIDGGWDLFVKCCSHTKHNKSLKHFKEKRNDKFAHENGVITMKYNIMPIDGDEILTQILPLTYLPV